MKMLRALIVSPQRISSGFVLKQSERACFFTGYRAQTHVAGWQLPRLLCIQCASARGSDLRLRLPETPFDGVVVTTDDDDSRDRCDRQYCGERCPDPGVLQLGDPVAAIQPVKQGIHRVRAKPKRRSACRGQITNRWQSAHAAQATAGFRHSAAAHRTLPVQECRANAPAQPDIRASD